MNEVPKSSWSRATAYTEGRRDAALLCMMSSRSRQAPIPELDPDTQSATWPRTLDRDGPFADMTLILVSNRLPVTVRRIGNRLDVQPNPGGVAAGPASFYREFQARWFGWPGKTAPRETKESSSTLQREFGLVPAFFPPTPARPCST